MSMNPPPIIVGAFRDRTMAEQAMEALSNAGFDRSQIHYAGPGTAGGFVEGIKNLFTGTNATDGNLTNDLTGMGLSDEEARYYANEYNNGSAVIAVKAPGREQEAMDLLHKYGAYNYNMMPSAKGAAGYGQPASYATSGGNPPAQQQDVLPPETREPVQAGVRQPPQQAQPGVVTVPRDTNPALTSEAEFQEAQKRLQTVQQQLQEARAQLQAAKEREAQVRQARERKGQLQETYKQIQDAQSELQAIQAELRETQARTAQYQ